MLGEGRQHARTTTTAVLGSLLLLAGGLVLAGSASADHPTVDAGSYCPIDNDGAWAELCVDLFVGFHAQTEPYTVQGSDDGGDANETQEEDHQALPGAIACPVGEPCLERPAAPPSEGPNVTILAPSLDTGVDTDGQVLVHLPNVARDACVTIPLLCEELEARDRAPDLSLGASAEANATVGPPPSPS